jgi:ATP-dependent Zn protease
LLQVAERTQGFSAADLENIWREAALATLRQDVNAAYVTRELIDHLLLNNVAENKHNQASTGHFELGSGHPTPD